MNFWARHVCDHPTINLWIADVEASRQKNAIGDGSNGLIGVISNWLDTKWQDPADEAQCKELSIRLRAFLKTQIEVGPKIAQFNLRKTAKFLLEAPGGLELLEEIGKAYLQEARQRTWRWMGLGAVWAHAVERVHHLSSCVSLLRRGFRMMKLSSEIDNRRSSPAGPEPSTEPGESVGGGGGADGPAPEGLQQMEKSLQLHGLRFMWTVGKHLLGRRVRRAAELVLADAEQPYRRALADAMIQVRQGDAPCVRPSSSIARLAIHPPPS